LIIVEVDFAVVVAVDDDEFPVVIDWDFFRLFKIYGFLTTIFVVEEVLLVIVPVLIFERAENGNTDVGNDGMSDINGFVVELIPVAVFAKGTSLTVACPAAEPVVDFIVAFPRLSFRNTFSKETTLPLKSPPLPLSCL
jgi:hypothetical protein